MVIRASSAGPPRQQGGGSEHQPTPRVRAVSTSRISNPGPAGFALLDSTSRDSRGCREWASGSRHGSPGRALDKSGRSPRMTSPFTARQAGLASIVAAGLILVSQVSRLVLPLTMPESFWIATQSLRIGLALLAMFALLLALTGLYSRQVPGGGRLGLVGYLTASLGTMLVAATGGTKHSLVRHSGSRPPSSSPRLRAARSSSAPPSPA